MFINEVTLLHCQQNRNLNYDNFIYHKLKENSSTGNILLIKTFGSRDPVKCDINFCYSSLENYYPINFDRPGLNSIYYISGHMVELTKTVSYLFVKEILLRNVLL